MSYEVREDSGLIIFSTNTGLIAFSKTCSYFVGSCCGDTPYTSTSSVRSGHRITLDDFLFYRTLSIAKGYNLYFFSISLPMASTSSADVVHLLSIYKHEGINIQKRYPVIQHEMMQVVPHHSFYRRDSPSLCIAGHRFQKQYRIFYLP